MAEQRPEQTAAEHPGKAMSRRTLSDFSFIVDVVAGADPVAANALLTGAIANVVGAIKDERWEGMMKLKEEPCGQPGCACEVMRSQLMSGLDSARKDWKRVLGKK